MRRIVPIILGAFACGLFVGWLLARPSPREAGPTRAPDQEAGSAGGPHAAGPRSVQTDRAPGLRWPRRSPASERGGGAVADGAVGNGAADAGGRSDRDSASNAGGTPEPPRSSVPDWLNRPWPDDGNAGGQALRNAAEQADAAAEALDGCKGVQVQAVDCSAPPCLVFFAAPGAACLALSDWNDYAPGCTHPLATKENNPDGLVLSAPISCPDGYVECVHALIATSIVAIPGFETAEGTDFDRQLEVLFSVGHRLTRSAATWACQQE